MSETAALRAGAAPLARAVLPAFAAAILTSAFLLFAVQPLFAKFALPVLGGAPNVWNTAMVFFQAALLGGYVYAHLLSRYLPLRAQFVVHGAVLAFGFVFLPIGLPSGWTPPSDGNPALWLIALMAVSVGAPFFALSANAPLLQRWFSHTDHPTANDPYYLYAASNIGSLGSLLAYPFLIEPNLSLGQQSHLWAMGYVALAALALAAAALTPRRGGTNALAPAAGAPTAAGSEAATETDARRWRRRGVWTLLALVPSALMLAVTTHLTSDIAAVPLLWILPLSLYLMSFIVVFSESGRSLSYFCQRAGLPLVVTAATTKFIMIAAVGVFDGLDYNIWITPVEISVQVVMFFAVCVALHGALAQRRPAAAQLTEFYLCMSLGGVVGGAFTALVAPVAFPGSWEYPILLIAAALLIVRFGPNSDNVNTVTGKTIRFLALATGVTVFAAIGAVIALESGAVRNGIAKATIILPAIAIVLCYRTRNIPVLAAASVAAALAGATAAFLAASEDSRRLFQDRSFFGAVYVEEKPTDYGLAHNFVHGVTVHNTQLRHPGERREILAYYGPYGPYGDVVEAMRTRRPDGLRAGVIGLGTGALACYARAGDNWTFYEIDPLVVDVARNDALFSFVSECAPDAPIKLGDGRLLVADEAARGEAPLDIVFVDAFSSDAVPAHLLTVEAMQLFRERTAGDGVLLYQVSNRHLDVASVVIRAAMAAGLDWRRSHFVPTKEMPYHELIYPAEMVVVGAPGTFDDWPRRFSTWTKAEPNPAVTRAWTDDYSSIVAAMRARHSGGVRAPAPEAGKEEAAGPQ